MKKHIFEIDQVRMEDVNKKYSWLSQNGISNGEIPLQKYRKITGSRNIPKNTESLFYWEVSNDKDIWSKNYENLMRSIGYTPTIPRNIRIKHNPDLWYEEENIMLSFLWYICTHFESLIDWESYFDKIMSWVQNTMTYWELLRAHQKRR